MSDRTRDDHSRRDFLTLGGVAAGAAFGATLVGTQQAALAQTAGLKVALVDIGVVFKNYQRKNALEKQINAKKDKLEAQGKQQAQIIENLRKALDLLKEGSELWRQKRKDLKLEAKKFEVMRDGMDEELKLEVENLTLQILDEIEERVREFGKSQAYDLIVKIDTKGWGDEKFQERIFRAQVSSVLYYDAKLDVTNTIVAMLNDPGWIKKCEEKAFGGNGGAPQNPAPPTNPPPAVQQNGDNKGGK
jgi:hypothetical protein